MEGLTLVEVVVGEGGGLELAVGAEGISDEAPKEASGDSLVERRPHA